MEGLVFLDESLADRCSEWVPREKRFVVPNTVGDDILVSNDEARTKIEKRAARADFRVLFVSNMIRSKGYLDVLDALRILNDRSIDFAATFAGSWESSEDEDRFWYLVKSGGLKGRVRHLGAVTDRKEIRQMFVEADVFVLPTYYSTEAQPLSILEAMNAATPVVVTRHAAIPHMVAEGKEGIFVEARNADSVADALESLVERTTWQELAHGAKRRFEQDFHPSVVRSRWNQLLSSEANRRG